MRNSTSSMAANVAASQVLPSGLSQYDTLALLSLHRQVSQQQQEQQQQLNPPSFSRSQSLVSAISSLAQHESMQSYHVVPGPVTRSELLHALSIFRAATLYGVEDRESSSNNSSVNNNNTGGIRNAYHSNVVPLDAAVAMTALHEQPQHNGEKPPVAPVLICRDSESTCSIPSQNDAVSQCSEAGSNSSSPTPVDTATRCVKESPVQPNDILLGRCKLAYAHPGNQIFRQLIHEYRLQYQTAQKRVEKHRIVTDIMRKVDASGGRFLKSANEDDEDLSSWLPVSMEIAYEKVSHALRNKKSQNSQELKSSKLKKEQRSSLHVVKVGSTESNHPVSRGSCAV